MSLDDTVKKEKAQELNQKEEEKKGQNFASILLNNKKRQYILAQKNI